MNKPREIVSDMRRQRIREAARAELVDGGPAALRPGRVARRASLPVDVVVDLVPDLEAAVVVDVEQQLAA